MGKEQFLTYFQQNLCEALSQLLQEDWNFVNIVVSEEKNDLAGTFGGYIDIAIASELDPKKIVAIEIENKSSYVQAKTNIEKLKKWSHDSQYRSCSLLHVFNEDCNLTESQINDLVKYAKYNERKGHDFYYDFTFFQISDKRSYRSLARDLVDTKDFRTRLWKLIEDAGLID